MCVAVLLENVLELLKNLFIIVSNSVPHKERGYHSIDYALCTLIETPNERKWMIIGKVLSD